MSIESFIKENGPEVTLSDMPAAVQEIMKEKMDMLDKSFELNQMGFDVSLRKAGNIFQLMVEIEDTDESKQSFLKTVRRLADKTEADHYVLVTEAVGRTSDGESADIVTIQVEDKDHMYMALSVIGRDGKITDWHYGNKKPSKNEVMTGIICQSEVEDKGFFNPLRVSMKSIKELCQHLKSGNKNFVQTFYIAQSDGNVMNGVVDSKLPEDFHEEMKRGEEFLKDNKEGATLYLGFDEIEHEIFQIRQYVKNEKSQKFVKHMKNKKGVLLYYFKKGKWHFVKNNASIELKVEVEKLIPLID